MRAEVAKSAATTGAIPPPRPQMVEWRVVMSCAVPVAIAAGVFAVGGLAVGFASFLNLLCILGGSGIVLALYRARRPLARIDGRVGLRVGLLTGLLMVTAMGTGLAATGVVERFALHGMTNFDGELAQGFATVRDQMTEKMAEQEQSPEVQRRAVGYLAAPEVRAGFGLFYLGLLGAFVVLITTGLGGFAGLLQTRRRALRSGD